MTSARQSVDAGPGEVEAEVELAEQEFRANFADYPTADPQGGEDGATTPGGPTMVLVGLAIYGLVYWLRRRRRR